MTVITEDAAKKRFHQGAYYLLGMAANAETKLSPQTALPVLAVMAYLGAYAYPGGNLYDLKQVMVMALEPVQDKLNVVSLVDQALEYAEVFRRPWTEPGSAGEPTI